MKKIPSIFAVVTIVIFISCEEPQVPQTTVTSEPEIHMDYKSDKLYFSTYPQSSDGVKFLISPFEMFRPLNRIILLNKDSDTLAIAPLTEASFNSNFWIGEIIFDFEEGEYYQLRVEEPVNNDTIKVFQLPDYNHIYKSRMNSNTLASFKRLSEWDLSPDRNFLFLGDFEGNVRSNYRLQLNTGDVLKLENTVGSNLKALDKNRILHVTNGGPISADINLYDVEKKYSIPFGVLHGAVPLITRLTDGHFLFLNPGWPLTFTVVNVVSDERRVIPDFTSGLTYSYMQDRIGQLIFRRNLFDFENFSLSEAITPQYSRLMQYNAEEDLVIYTQGSEQAFGEDRYSKLVVGKRGEQPKFESNFEKNVFYQVPSETKILNNKFLIYIDYRENQDEHRVSGFYQVDLTDGSMELIHSEDRINTFLSWSAGFVQLEENLWMTIFSGEIGLYKVD